MQAGVVGNLRPVAMLGSIGPELLIRQDRKTGAASGAQGGWSEGHRAVAPGPVDLSHEQDAALLGAHMRLHARLRLLAFHLRLRRLRINLLIIIVRKLFN